MYDKLITKVVLKNTDVINRQNKTVSDLIWFSFVVETRMAAFYTVIIFVRRSENVVAFSTSM